MAIFNNRNVIWYLRYNFADRHFRIIDTARRDNDCDASIIPTRLVQENKYLELVRYRDSNVTVIKRIILSYTVLTIVRHCVVLLDGYSVRTK